MASSDVRDALVRVIACRLSACTEAELREIDARLMAIEDARDIDPVERGLIELRDAIAIPPPVNFAWDMTDEGEG